MSSVSHPSARRVRRHTLESADSLTLEVIHMLQARLGDCIDQYAIPPPVFTAMAGQFVAVDMDAGTLTARFPVRESYLNPYRTMQGGMIAAALDNTLGPLSMLVAPPNVTRRLEITYSRPVTVDMGSILVDGRLVERESRWLYFRAEVRSGDGLRLARSKATHWILDE